MRRSVFGVCILLLICLLQSPSYCQEEDKLTWDFGRVNEGEILQHDFIFKNESGKELKIKEVNATCACTVSQVKKKILKPGESTVIEVKLKSKGYNGEVKQYVYVTTDNLDNPLIRYIITAVVIKNK